jgi:hypothetical protein
VEEHLTAVKRRVPTHELADMLAKKGLRIGPEKRIVTNLSSYLSRDPRFQADRHLGWALVEWGGAKPPNSELALNGVGGEASHQSGPGAAQGQATP